MSKAYDLKRRYGLSLKEAQRLRAKGCHICGKKPRPGGRALHIDHEHQLGWKKMPPELKRTFVRGALCWNCNSLLRKRWPPAVLRKAADYLETPRPFAVS